MQRKPTRQRGAILVMTILFLVILLGFAALALDLGRLYVLRTEMQNAADSAALAAAAELDGGPNAIADAVIAAKELLSHRGRFATSPELLNILKYDPSLPPEENAFEFYSWINAEQDPGEPASCVHPPIYDYENEEWVDDENKCLALADGPTSADAFAHYVKVKLHPELVIDEEEYFQISLYFLPVLGLFLEDGTAMTASTRVSAVAGAGAAFICNYPPLFFCKDDKLEIGTQLKIVDQGASPTWAPGNFSYLQPGVEEIVVENPDGSTLVTWKNDPQIFIANLADEGDLGCTDATVQTDPGASVGNIRRGFNSRFDIYDSKLGDYKDHYVPAFNVIDYPRDDCFTSDSCPGAGGRYGDGIATVTEDDTLPSTYSFDDYFGRYLKAEEINVDGEITGASRYNAYVAESAHLIGTMPRLNNDLPDEWWDNVYNTEEHCAGDINKDCRNLDGNPVLGGTYTTDFDRRFNRRILYVAQLDCEWQAENAKFTGLSAELDVFGGDPGGNFVKFFLTESVPKGGEAHVYAEYLGEVSETDEKYQDLIHTQIQLYE